MRNKKFLTIIIVLLGLQYSANAQDTNEIFTIYLVRHAEKQQSSDNPRDPSLTDCGIKRAESLAGFLGKVDLSAIYSTDFTRTRNTAKPTADSQGITIKMYNPRELNSFAKLLINSKEDALVVGHSNTTGVLAGLLVGEDIEPFKEDIYNRIYQVVFYKETGRLHIFQSTFACNN